VIFFIYLFLFTYLNYEEESVAKRNVSHQKGRDKVLEVFQNATMTVQNATAHGDEESWRCPRTKIIACLIIVFSRLSNWAGIRRQTAF
jgi:hypothetical protein